MTRQNHGHVSTSNMTMPIVRSLTWLVLANVLSYFLYWARNGKPRTVANQMGRNMLFAQKNIHGLTFFIILIFQWSVREEIERGVRWGVF